MSLALPDGPWKEWSCSVERAPILQGKQIGQGRGVGGIWLYFGLYRGWVMGESGNQRPGILPRGPADSRRKKAKEKGISAYLSQQGCQCGMETKGNF